MPVAKGKHELKTHIPQRTYQYLKAHAEGRQIGQLIADCVECYANLGKLARQSERIEGLVHQLLEGKHDE